MGSYGFWAQSPKNCYKISIKVDILEHEKSFDIRPGDFRKSRKPVFGSVYQIHGKLSETTFWFCKINFEHDNLFVL